MRTEFKWLGLLISILAVAGCFLWEKIRVWRNQKNPITTVEAFVAERERICHHSKYGVRYGYQVRFKPVDGGESLLFGVSEAEYDAYRLGDCGMLSYRTWEFISFRPERRENAGKKVPVAFAEEEDA